MRKTVGTMIVQLHEKIAELEAEIERKNAVLEQARKALEKTKCSCRWVFTAAHAEPAPQISPTAQEIVPERKHKVICKRCAAIAAIEELTK